MTSDDTPTRLAIAVAEEDLKDALEASSVANHAEMYLWDMESPAPRETFDIVVPHYWEGRAGLENLEGLNVRLVQWQSIGFDGIEDILPKGIPLANAATVHETSTSELAVGLAIAMQRGFLRAMAQTGERVWKTEASPGLADRRVLLLGFGGVGKAIEARLEPFETDVTIVARSARTDETLSGRRVHVHGIDELDQLLPEAEIVIIGLPLTDETRGLFDGDRLARLADGALLVNVGRGPIVDTDALVRELMSGRIRAALDVVDPEPLPREHPLWEAPNLLLTPHIGGDTAAMLPRVVRLIERQVAHLLAGEPFENIVLGD